MKAGQIEMNETLPQVPFGGTDMRLSRVGFGAWASAAAGGHSAG
jgi:hypothetical protein